MNKQLGYETKIELNKTEETLTNEPHFMRK